MDFIFRFSDEKTDVPLTDLESRARPPGTHQRKVALALFVPGVATGASLSISSVHVVTMNDVVKLR